MKHSSMSYRSKAIVSTTALLCLFTACTETPVEKRQEQAQPFVLASDKGVTDVSPDSTSFQKSLTAKVKIRSAHPWVSQAELIQGGLDFPRHFRKDRNWPITNTEVVIPYDSIARIASAIEDTFSNPIDQDVLLRIQYGLVEPEMRLGLCFVPMRRRASGSYIFDFQDGGPVMHWHAGRFTSWSNIKAWEDEFKSRKNSGAYFNEVEVMPDNDGPWFDALPDLNTSCYSLPWKLELERMLYDNRNLIDLNDTVWVVFTSVADAPDERWRHVIYMHLRVQKPGLTTTMDLIDDEGHAGEGRFYMRGCDLGNLCPPSCPSYYVLPEELRD